MQFEHDQLPRAFRRRLPRPAIEFTINKMIEFGNLPAEMRPAFEKAVDPSVAQEALSRLGAVPGVE